MEDKVAYVTSELQKEIKTATKDGFTLHLRLSPGADMIFARLVVELQEKNPQIHLEVALPYPTWFEKRGEKDKVPLQMYWHRHAQPEVSRKLLPYT